MNIINLSGHITRDQSNSDKNPFLSKLGLRESNRAYLIPPTLFHPPKPKINEKMGDLPKLARSRDVTGKVDNVHSNLLLIFQSNPMSTVHAIEENLDYFK